MVQDEETLGRLQLSLDDVTLNATKLSKVGRTFADKLFEATEKMYREREEAQTALLDNQLTVDVRLYDGFITDSDKQTMRAVRGSNPVELSELSSSFDDERLKNLIPLYKARNFPKHLTEDEQATWDKFCYARLVEGGKDSRLAKYFDRLQELSATKLTGEQQFLVEELKLYGESIIPENVTG